MKLSLFIVLLYSFSPSTVHPSSSFQGIMFFFFSEKISRKIWGVLTLWAHCVFKFWAISSKGGGKNNIDLCISYCETHSYVHIKLSLIVIFCKSMLAGNSGHFKKCCLLFRALYSGINKSQNETLNVRNGIKFSGFRRYSNPLIISHSAVLHKLYFNLYILIYMIFFFFSEVIYLLRT